MERQCFLVGDLRTTIVAAAMTVSLGLAASMPAESRPTFVHAIAHGTTISPGAIDVLYSFAGPDGANPQGGLEFSFTPAGPYVSTTIFGATQGGGINSDGNLFSLGVQSGTFTDLFDFNGANGLDPAGGLDATSKAINYTKSGPFFGATNAGGQYGFGSIYEAFPSGEVGTLYSFTGGSDGANPAGRLVLVNNHVYGTTSAGAYGFGTVFRFSLKSGLQTMHRFTGGNDGGTPLAGLTARLMIPSVDVAARAAARQGKTINPDWASDKYKDNSLYGTTSNDGLGGTGNGTLFKISMTTGKVTTLYSFADSATAPGANPQAELISDFDGNLYGSTFNGGSAGVGEIFAFTPRTNKLYVLHDFATDPTSGNAITGANPAAALTIAVNGALYGTTSSGSQYGNGNVFKISATGFNLLYEFAGTDGASPQAQLVDGLDGNLYGTTHDGGLNGLGELFAIAE